MCKTKTGTEIILSQMGEYSFTDISSLVMERIRDAQIKLSHYDIYREISGNLDIFYQNGIVKTFNNGKYLTV